MADRRPPPYRSRLPGERVTWKVLVKRFRTSDNRVLAAKNLVRHAVRARFPRWVDPARAAAHELSVHTRIAVSFPFGFLRSAHQVVERWDAADRPLQAGVVLFVHFDPCGRVAQAARNFILGLAKYGLSVVFVSNSEQILDEDKNFLKQHCSAILIRRNIGYDFGAWRDALDTLGLPRAETRTIYLINDSVYGPFSDLQPLLEAVDFDRADLWGATESWQHRYHLQSFFLVCGHTAIRSEAWGIFWRSVRPIPCKDWIIRHCEIGFTGAMAAGGVRCAAIFPSAALLDKRELERLERIIDEDLLRRGENLRLHAEALHADRILHYGRRETNTLNPSVDLWRQLIHAGYPFLKRELLLKNPTKVTDVFEWEEVVAQALDADPQPLAAEIRRSLGPMLPEIWNSPQDLELSARHRARLSTAIEADDPHDPYASRNSGTKMSSQVTRRFDNPRSKR